MGHGADFGTCVVGLRQYSADQARTRPGRLRLEPAGVCRGLRRVMVWFGSSAGVALSNIFPQARSVGAWIKHGWFVPVAYFVGFFIMFGLVGWNPSDIPGDDSEPKEQHALVASTKVGGHAWHVGDLRQTPETLHGRAGERSNAVEWGDLAAAPLSFFHVAMGPGRDSAP